MYSTGSRLALAGFLLLFVAGVSACGGAGGGAGPGGSGQGLALVRFTATSVDNLPLNTRLGFEFSEAVDPQTVSPVSIQIREGPEYGRTVPGLFIVDGATVWFEPRLPGRCDLSDSGFKPNTPYRVQLIGTPEEFSIRNTHGQPLAATETHAFRTLADTDEGVLTDTMPGASPVVLSTSPQDGDQAVAVETGNAVRIQLSENVHPCSLDGASARIWMAETGDPGLEVTGPGGRASGFALGSDTSDQAPGDPWTWGTPGTTSLMPDPQVVPATITLEQSFTSTWLSIAPAFGRFPENALLVVQLTFDVVDFSGQSLTPYTFSFTTENREREESAYLVEHEGETPYDEAASTASIDDPELCPSRAQGFLLFAGDGDNGGSLETPTAPEDDAPVCGNPRDVNDGTLDHFSPTEDVVLDTGASRNLCPNSVDGSYAVVWEFASFYIGPGITVRLIGVNPAILLVRGDVTIDTGGRLLLAGTDGQNGKDYPSGSAGRAYGGLGVAGGGDGGDAHPSGGPALGEHGYVGYGSPDYGVLPQGGIGAGHGNTAVTTDSYSAYPSSASGGGGGHAVPGTDGMKNSVASSPWKTTPDGSGGEVYPTGSGAERMPTPSAGSGGGAAGWCTGPNNSSYYRHSGGAGGGGGGFVDITSSGNIRVYGTIDASGGDGGDGSLYYINRPFTGGGGGGSGGGIRLLTPLQIDLTDGTLDAGGGAGGYGAVSNYGGASQPNDGGAGGHGRIVLEDGDSVIGGQGSAALTPNEGTVGFYRGIFDPMRFQGGGRQPVAISEPFLVGSFDPEFSVPEQDYGGRQDFVAGIPAAATPPMGAAAMLIEARGYELLRDGTAASSPSVGWHTVGWFSAGALETQPLWHASQVDASLRPADNLGYGIDALDGCEFVQLRITFFLPTGFGAREYGPYLDDWRIRFEHDQ